LKIEQHTGPFKILPGADTDVAAEKPARNSGHIARSATGKSFGTAAGLLWPYSRHTVVQAGSLCRNSRATGLPEINSN